MILELCISLVVSLLLFLPFLCYSPLFLPFYQFSNDGISSHGFLRIFTSRTFQDSRNITRQELGLGADCAIPFSPLVSSYLAWPSITPSLLPLACCLLGPVHRHIVCSHTWSDLSLRIASGVCFCRSVILLVHLGSEQLGPTSVSPFSHLSHYSFTRFD